MIAALNADGVPALTVDDFREFFRQLHGNPGELGPEPFPWQERLVRAVAQTGQWPALLDLPTGSGKTAVLDIAVFLLALRGDQPRRMVFVVDRRIVVHQAALRARRLAACLADAKGGVLHAVAQRLQALTATGAGFEDLPLHCAELRGGIVSDDSWIERPDIPTVLVSTVDQVGSRLLFRGYGVSQGMRPVHAGLLANDVLYLLDEVHLAQPFAATLATIGKHYRPAPDSGLPDRWRVVELSATPTAQFPPDQVFRLSAEDRDPAMTPVLAQRLEAKKPARLQLVKVTGSDHGKHREALAAEATRQVEDLLARSTARTIGVVVNRVDTASRVYRRFLDRTDMDVLLLTGRMRPLDRDGIFEEYKNRLQTGRVRNSAAKPLVLVATQAIEAGADFDLDVLVTECAPLDSLVQRFGRVDRTGQLANEGKQSTSVVLAASADVSESANDPIYGQALRLTWEWLNGRDLDFGIAAFAAVDKPSNLTSQSREAPYLLASHLDRWVQTSDTPDADPEPAHWLHGLGATNAEVTVVWRADVIREAFEGDEAADRLRRLVGLCPPGSGEAMQLPISAVRAWLVNLEADGAEPDPSVADVTSDQSEETPSRDSRLSPLQRCAPALLWHKDADIIRKPADLRPGCTIVVPARYGGIQGGTWAPESLDSVCDLGSEVQAIQRGRAVLRLLPGSTGPSESPHDREPEEPGDKAAERRQVLTLLDNFVPPVENSDTLLQVAKVLRRDVRKTKVTKVDLHGSSSGHDDSIFVVSLVRRVPELVQLSQPGTKEQPVIPADSEPDTSPFSGAAISLDRHLTDVEKWAGSLALACGMPDNLANDLALAGRLHDLGKADPRFQNMLRHGVTTTIKEDAGLLAKSSVASDDRSERRRAAIAAGYPAGTRHELTSVALVEHEQSIQAQAADWDLVLHLVASHHGYGRPFMPVAESSRAEDVRLGWGGKTLVVSTDHGLERLDSGVPQRFWRCVRRYGWFGLAWLEAVLRLADHRASEAATKGPL